MQKLYILFIFMLSSSFMFSQTLVLKWKVEKGEKLGGDIYHYMPPNDVTLSDYNGDGTADVVLSRKEGSTLYILDGKTRQPIENLEIEQTANLCDNEVIKRFHSSFADIGGVTATVILSRKMGNQIRGTRDDNNVVMSGGTTMITYPCEYALIGFADLEGDGYYTILLENLQEDTVSFWGIE